MSTLLSDSETSWTPHNYYWSTPKSKEMNVTFSSLLPPYINLVISDKLLSHVSLQWCNSKPLKKKRWTDFTPQPAPTQFPNRKTELSQPHLHLPTWKKHGPRTSWHWRPLVPHLVASVATPTRNLPSAPARNDLRYVNGILRSSFVFFFKGTVPGTRWKMCPLPHDGQAPLFSETPSTLTLVTSYVKLSDRFWMSENVCSYKSQL